MKLRAVILLCALALGSTRGADVFGTKEPFASDKLAAPSASEFLNVPWNSTPAEAKRVMATPAGTKVKEDLPDRIVLIGGTFETYPVESWELDFVNGKFTKGIVKLVRRDEKNAKGWINDQMFDAIRERLHKKYGNHVEHDGWGYSEFTCEAKDSGAITKVTFHYGWAKDPRWTTDPRLEITYSYNPAPLPALPIVQARHLPTNEIELQAFLIGTRWTIDGQPQNTYEFLANGSYKSSALSVQYAVTGSRRFCVTWSPQLKIDCEFNESFSEFRELGGSHNVFKPVQPAAVVSTPGEPASRDLVKTYRNSLVFVTGADGSGSGFVATLGGANFLFTNAHVAAGIKGAGFKSLDGTKVTGGAATIAVGHDIFRMQLPAGGTPFEVMLGVDEKVTIDDEVVVLGNAEGAGVINTIKGKVVGVGPQLVEVDAPFQPGNSGSPIIHLKTGKVIGVATYLTIKKYDAATKEVLKAPVVRRFGYRLDSVKTWQPVSWPAFYAQAAEMQAIETLTGDLDSFLVDLSQHHGKVTSGAHSNPAIKTRIDQWLADKKKRLNPKDAASVDQNFISFLKVASRADVAAARQRMTYEYFMRGLTGVEQDRSAIIEIFDKIIGELQKER